jgi:hypothetical protein
MRLSLLMLAVPLFLASCGQGENDPGPGGVTVGEARALDDAAEMLDQRRSPADGAAVIAAPLPPTPTPAPKR